MSTYIRTLPIVGARFRPPALGILSVLPSACALILRREPSNAHDSNAIQVLVARSALEPLARLGEACEGFGYSRTDVLARPEWHLGYVPRESASELAPLMDKIASAGAISLVKELPAVLTFDLSGRPCAQGDFGS